MNMTTLREAAFAHKDLIPMPFDIIMEQDGGFDAICAIVAYYGGQTVYMPSLRTIFGECMKEELRLELKLNKYASRSMLTRKYGFSDRHISRILGLKT